MKWIKSILVLAMVIFAHSTISINDVEANRSSRSKTHTTKKASHSRGKAHSSKSAHKGKAEKPAKKGGFFSSLKSKFSAFGAKVKAGAASLKDKMSNGINCRAGKGTAPGKALFTMALKEKLTDAHIVAAHASPGKHAGGSGRRGRR